MKAKSKHLEAVYDNNMERLPRKIKKAIYGKKISRAKLRGLLQSVTIVQAEYDGQTYTKISPYAFCPCCGSTMTRSGHNRAEWPEVWITHYCIKCHYPVAMQDNGPYVHCLELGPPYKF